MSKLSNKLPSFVVVKVLKLVLNELPDVRGSLHGLVFELLESHLVFNILPVLNLHPQSGLEDTGLSPLLPLNISFMNLVHDHIVDFFSDIWVVINPLDIVLLGFLDRSILIVSIVSPGMISVEIVVVIPNIDLGHNALR